MSCLPSKHTLKLTFGAYAALLCLSDLHCRLLGCIHQHAGDGVMDLEDCVFFLNAFWTQMLTTDMSDGDLRPLGVFEQILQTR